MSKIITPKPTAAISSVEKINHKIWANEQLAKKSFFALFIFTTLIMIVSAFDFPPNVDEIYHVANGKANLKFYTSLGEDTSYINPPALSGNKAKDMSLMHYYGVLTDVTGEVFANTLKIVGIDYMDGKHIWNVLFTMLGVFFTGLTARLLSKSWWAASLSLLIMMATPSFTGFAYNLTKDMPMAAGFIIAIYAIFRLFFDFDKPLNKKIILLLVLGITIAIGNRIAGILIFVYIGFFGIWAIYRHRKSVSTKDIRTKVLWIAGAMIVGFFGGLLFWPYALVSPIDHVIEAFGIASKYPIKGATFFDGESMDVSDPYWYFLPKYLLITTPIIFLVGIALSLCFLLWKKMRQSGYGVVFVMLAFPSFFPILYIIYKHTVVYQNWRHILFAFPTMVLLSTVGWYYLMSRWKKGLFILPVFILLFLKPVIWMVQHHPYEYTYFNEFIGDLKDASEKYEIDSYGFSIKYCMKWIGEHNDLKKDTLIINCSDDEYATYASRQYIKQPVKNIIGGFRTRNAKDWDYGVYGKLFLVKEEREKFFPPQNYELVHTEYVDDVPVYIVLKRKGRLDMLGLEASAKSNFPLADSLLSLYNKQSDYYAPACVGMEMVAKLNLQRFKEAKELYDVVQRKNRTLPEIDYYGAVAYAYSGDVAKARMILSNAIEQGMSSPEAYQLMQQLNQQTNGANTGGGPMR